MPRFDDEEEYGWEDEEESAGPDDDEEDDDEVGLDTLIEVADELVETGEARQAIRLWRRSIERFSDEPEAYYHQARACYGYLLEQLGDEFLENDQEELLPIHNQAISALEEALAMEPDDAASWNLLGDLYRMKENWATALDSYKKAYKLDPDLPVIEDKIDEARDELGE
jgi:tetratricopeptide (TPR) repeat protein